MRQAPFDMHYITYTHLLDHLDKRIRIINRPKGVRNSPEKLLVTHFSDLMPDTLISKYFGDKKFFFTKKVVIKPLYGKGGDGIILLNIDDKLFDEKLEKYIQDKHE